MKERKLENYQAVAIIVTVMLSHIILNLPNHLISQTGSATIFNFLYVFGIVMIICWLVTKFFKLFPNSDLIDICEYTGGKVAKNIYTIALLVYLFTVSGFVIRIFAESLVLIYFPNMEVLYHRYENVFKEGNKMAIESILERIQTSIDLSEEEKRNLENSFKNDNEEKE